MRQSDRAQLDRRLQIAEVEIAKQTGKKIIALLGEEALAAPPIESARITAGVTEFKRIVLSRSPADTDACDIPRILLEAVHHHHPAVAERVAAQVGITITTTNTERAVSGAPDTESHRAGSAQIGG